MTHDPEQPAQETNTLNCNNQSRKPDAVLRPAGSQLAILLIIQENVQ